MSRQTVPADFSGHMLDLDEDEDLEVFSKVKGREGQKKPNPRRTLSLNSPIGGYVDFDRGNNTTHPF